MKKIIALITALAITISAFSGVMIVVAESDELTPEVTEVTIDGQPYEDGKTECHNGSEIEAKLTWKIPEGQTHFQYYLGDIQLNGNQKNEGTIYDKENQPVGTWHFDVESGMITIDLDKPMDECWVQFEGIIPLDPVEDKEGEAKDLYFGGETLHIVPSYDKGGNVNVSKSVGVDNSPYFNEADGTFVIKNKIIVTVSDNYVSDINLTDMLSGENVDFPSDFDVSVSYKPVDGNPEPNSDCVDTYTLDVNGKQFDMTLPGSFAPGDVIEITYETIISMEGMAEVFNGDKSVTANSVSGTFTDIKDSTGEKHFNDTTSQLYSYSEPSIKKYGAWQDQEKGIIKWTITFDPGVYGDIDKYINNPDALAELGIKNLTETLGPNQTICDSEGNPLTFDLSGLTLSDFTPDPWGNSFTFEFYTKADTTESSEFSNDVSINVFDTAVAEGSASVEIKDLDIKKTTAQPKPNDDGTMDWSIQIYVPYGEYESITVIDTPSPDNENKSGYTHSVVEDNIKIGNDTVETAKATVTSTPENGVKIVLPYSYVEQYKGQYITITLKTKAEKGGISDDAFKGTYNWVNEAKYYTDAPNKSVSSDAAYEKSEAELQLKKYGEAVKTKGENGEDIYTTIAEWRIEVSNFVKYDSDDWVGSLFSEQGLTLDLTDTLPDHMEYVEGSAYAVPYEYSNPYGDLQKTEYLDQAKELFSQGLNIVNNGNTLTIKWSADAALKQQLQDFIKSTKLVYDTYTSLATSIFSSGTSLSIYYRTQIKEDYIDTFLTSGYTAFNNTVEGKINNKDVGPTSASVGLNYNNKAIAKETPYEDKTGNSNTYDPDNLDQYGIYWEKDWKTSEKTHLLNVPFKIDVNPQRLSLGKDGTLFVEDTMGASLTLLQETVRITNMDTGEVEKCISIDSTPAADGKTMWSFEMPDGVHYKLTYFCELTAEVDSEGTTTTYKDIVDSSNSVKFRLHQGLNTAKSNQFYSVKFPKAGALKEPSTDLKLTKVDKDNNEIHLSGAEFKFEVYTCDNTGNLTLVTNKREVVKSSTDGSITYFAATHPENEIYMIQETEAPADYDLDPEKHYYICEDYNKDLKDVVKEKYGAITLKKNKTGDNKYEFTFTNIKSSSQPKTAEAGLTVTKEFKGGTLEGEDFTFQISQVGNESGMVLPTKTIVTNDADGSVDFGTITFNKSGTFKVKIEETGKNDQTIIYDPNPRYITYKVDLEADSPTVEKTYGDENEKVTNPAEYLTFTNILTSSLKISKKVDGDGAKYDENEFKFTVTLTDTDKKPVTGKFDCTSNITDLTSVSTDSEGKITFKLKHNDWVEISGIPVGTKYAVREDFEGYIQEAHYNEGEISGNGSTPEVKFINKRKVGSLSISKTVEKATAEDKEKSFKFTVTLTDGNEKALVDQTFDVEWTNADSNAPNTVKTNENGEFTVDLSDGQTIKIKGLPEKTHYMIAEDEKDANTKGYEKVSEKNSKGDIKENETAEVSFTNKRIEMPKGNLSISKTVENATAEDEEKSFKFTVTLTDENKKALDNQTFDVEWTPADNSKPTTKKTDEYGKFTVLLSDDQTITIKGLPEKTHYVIVEDEADANTQGYEKVSEKNSKGDIKENETAEVTFTNKRIEIPKGSLSISKTVVDPASEGTITSFDFTVTLTDENKIALANQTFDVEWTPADSSKPTTKETDKDGKFTVSLSHNQTITIKDLPVNTNYTVEEKTYDNYDQSVSGEKEGKITGDVSVSFVNTYNQSQGTDTDDGSGDNSSDNNSSGPENTPNEPDGDGGDGDGTPDSNGSNSESEKEPSFDIPTIPSTPQDTTKPVGGSLTVSKTVAGDGAEADREFTFTIEFKNADGTVVTDYFSYGGSKSGTIKSGDTFTLKHGESIIITNLPDGVIYNVSEVETDGYISKSTDSSGIVYAGQSHSASFVNEAVTTSEETTTTVAVDTSNSDNSPDVTESSVTVSESSAAESATTDRNSAVDGYGDSKDKIPNTANKGDQNIMFMFISLAAAFTGTTAILIRRKKSH